MEKIYLVTYYQHVLDPYYDYDEYDCEDVTYWSSEDKAKEKANSLIKTMKNFIKEYDDPGLCTLSVCIEEMILDEQTTNELFVEGYEVEEGGVVTDSYIRIKGVKVNEN